LSIAPETSEARFDDGGNSPLAALPHARHATSVHLHHAPGAQDHAAGQGDPEGHLARLLRGREDRRPRPQRRGQIDAAQDHGGRRRVALCQVLLRQPDLLLLDEPTNHLDAESVAWLERHLQEYPGTVVAITHDRYFLDNVAGWILELDRGFGIPWEGNYSSWLEQKERRLAQEEKEASGRRRALARELEWVRMAPRARQAKGKARLARYEELLAQDQAGEGREGPVRITIPPGPRLGNLVIEAEGVRKGYGDRLLMDGVSFILPRGGIV